jgi:hypothetical protein
MAQTMRQWQDRFLPRSRHLFMLGTILAILGCLLPWVVEGDIVSIWTYGIRIELCLVCSRKIWVEDGWAIPVFICLALAWLPLSDVSSTTKYRFRLLSVMIALLLSTLYLIRFLVYIAASNPYVIGAPELQIGLPVLIAGTLLMVLSSLTPLTQEPTAT